MSDPDYVHFFNEIDDNYISEDERDLIWNPYSLRQLAFFVVQLIDCSNICGKFECLTQYAKDSISWIRITNGSNGSVIQRFQGKAIDDIRKKHPDVEEFRNVHFLD